MKMTALDWVEKIVSPKKINVAKGHTFTAHSYKRQQSSRFKMITKPCAACGAEMIAPSRVEKALCPECRGPYIVIQGHASSKVSIAIRHGDLKEPAKCKCVDCGEVAKHYDHRDYAKPLDVDPVCVSCNALRGMAQPFRSKILPAHTGKST